MAHVAARHGHLPEGFNLWEIDDGQLRPRVDQFDLGDTSRHWTEAQEAASHGRLSPGFNRWDIADWEERPWTTWPPLRRAESPGLRA